MEKSNDLPVLYSFRRCPYAIRARYAVLLNSKHVILREVDLNEKPKELLKISQKATVPVLLFPDKRIIDESLDIVLWAYGLSEENISKENLDLLLMNDHKFKVILDCYKYPERNLEVPRDYVIDQALDYLRIIDVKLSNSNYLFTDTVGLCDISIFPFIRQFYNCDKDFFNSLKLKKLQRWLTKIMHCEYFSYVMMKRLKWEPGHKDIIFSRSESLD